MTHLPLSHRLLRAASLLFLSCCIGAAAAQGTEVTDVEGTKVNLLIPAGYCKLARDAEPGKSFYAQQERMQQGTNLVLLIFGDCSELSRLKSGAGGGIAHYGIYMAPFSGGHAAKLPPAMSRAAAIDDVAKTIPALDPAAVEKTVSSRAGAEGVAVNRMTTGLLGKDANGVYVGVAANVAGNGQNSRVQAVSVITFLKGVAISCHLYGPPAAGAPFGALLAAQKLQAAALVKAN